MLVDLWRKKEIPIEVLITSAPILKMREKIPERSFNAIHKRLKNAIDNVDPNDSGGYTIFGMVLGHQSFLSKADYDFIWDHMYETFGKSEEAFNFNKRALGTMLMACFAADQRNWLVSLDREKKTKLENGEIPDAAEYFLDSTGKGYASIKRPKVVSKSPATKSQMIQLAARFNKR